MDTEDVKYSALPRELRLLLKDYLNSTSADKWSKQSLAITPEAPIAWQGRRPVVDKLDLNLQDELDLVGELAKTTLIITIYCVRQLKNKYNMDVGITGNGSLRGLELMMLQSRNLNTLMIFYRYFVVTESPIHRGLKVMRDREVNYALTAIDTDPGNECAWKYLRRLFKGDMQSLVLNLLVEGAIVSVLTSERNRVNFLDGKDEDAPSIKRGVVYALEMVLDLLNHGYEPSNALIDVTETLCPGSCPPDAGFC